MIEAVFFARFHAEKGPIVLHQWPENAVSSAPGSKYTPLFDFTVISEYIIPRQDLCQQPLAVCINGYRILGHPMCLADTEKYARNEYIFNFCFVLRERTDFSAYEKTFRQLARILADAEEQEDLLSEDEDRTEQETGSEDEDNMNPSVAKMQLLCENVMDDLNRYSECIIPITNAHEINLKLFPSVPPAPQVKPFHVPLGLIDLAGLGNELWDMTMQRTLPHIDGVNHVAQIAELAQSDTTLVQQAVRQLLRFDLVILLDIFQYGATYAPTSDIGRIFFDEVMQDECATFSTCKGGTVRSETIVKLYTSLCHGVTLKTWAIENQHLLENVDVRRFIIAGLMKGIIYRVHRYALKDATGKSTPSTSSQDRQIDRFLDGTHAFDEICVTLSIPPNDLYARLQSRKDVYIFER